MASWLRRAVLAGLLLAAYLFAWTPARTVWVTHLAEPVLKHTSAPNTRVSARSAAHTVRVQASGDAAFTYTAPAGVKFLLPGFFLLLLAPTRPPLGLFFLGHLSLGTVALGLLALETSELLRFLAGFIQTYGVDAYSLMVPVLVLIWPSPTE